MYLFIVYSSAVLVLFINYESIIKFNFSNCVVL